MRNRDIAKSVYTVASVAALPATGRTGDVYLVVDGGLGYSSLYFWDSNTSSWRTDVAGWKVIRDTTLLAPVSSYQWDSLNGDLARYFRLRWEIYGLSSVYTITFNGDSGANYIRQSVYVNNASPTGINQSGRAGYEIAGGGGSGISVGELLLRAESGRVRVAEGSYSYNVSTIGTGVVCAKTVLTWTNTVDNIISIEWNGATADLDAGSSMSLEEWTGVI